MSPADKKVKLVRNKGLCENCLYSNHNTQNCRNSSTCSIPGCGRKHSKFLHISSPVRAARVAKPTSVETLFKITDCASTKNLTKTLIKSSEPKCLRLFVQKLMILLQSYCLQEKTRHFNSKMTALLSKLKTMMHTYNP